MIKTNIKFSNEELLFIELKEILLREDRMEIQKLKESINDPEKLTAFVSPIIKEHLEFLKENFSKEYKELIDKLITEKLKDSQEEIINILYPMMGQMIKKYIKEQFQQLKENIENRIKSTFSTKSFFNLFRSRFMNTKEESEIILSSLDKPIIEEIYVIERNSGILIASASKEKVIDQEVIAGMLTAIKNFVEDAFEQEKQELEMISYGTYKIFIQNFYSYYIAIAITGSVSAKEQDVFSSELLNFAQNELSANVLKLNGSYSEIISEKLYHSFIKQAIKELSPLSINTKTSSKHD